MNTDRPVFVLIAGPNGAGKTTLYENRVRFDFPKAEFVNADRMAQQFFGHPADTEAESKKGQELAETRRRELMSAHKSLITESTFSHPSKLDLLRDAKAAGYVVLVYHVHVRSADLAVLRVSGRVEQGGHPVPEDRTRARYERNQPLIREAAKSADYAFVFDNSEYARPHRQAFVLRDGEAITVSGQVPAWARELYAPELKRYSPHRLNGPAASFVAARSITEAVLGSKAVLRIARRDGQYHGPIVGETELHVIQQLGKSPSAVAHFVTALERKPAIGESARILYQGEGHKARVLASRESVVDREAAERARAFEQQSESAVLKRYPDLASAYEVLRQADAVARSQNPEQAHAVLAAVKSRLVDKIEKGEAIRLTTDHLKDQQRGGRDR